MHVRAAGGYVVAAPSLHASGRNYRWINRQPIAELPDWLRQWLSGYEISTKSVPDNRLNLGQLPVHLQNQNTKDISAQTLEALKSVYSPTEHARVASALQAIDVKTCNYDDFLRVGMALKELDWQKSDGTDIGFELWDAWCSLSPHHNPAGLEFKWQSFRRSGVSVGSLYHLAQQHGWSGGAPALATASPSAFPGPGLNGHASGSTSLPAAFLAAQKGAIFFPDLTEEGKVRSTMLNAKVAIAALGVECKYDLFHNRMLVAGELISKWNSTELSDHVATMIRDVIRYRFGFDPNKQNVQDACEALCLGHRFDPVLDYLDSLRWDGQPRLDRWLTVYLSAPDNAYTHAVARLSLIAAVRRARRPGTKFDQIIIFEGPQGQGKSEAIEILAGSDNFSDQSILGVDDRKQQELTEGVWLYEIGELSGMRKAEIEHIKAFASRKVDRARPAYGRYTINQPRRTVFFGSTNQDTYLQDDTGNRRFWPVPVGRIDLAALRKDRDQLWAEAAARETANESHLLPATLWKVAGEVQRSRNVIDPWEEQIGNYIALKDTDNVSISDVLINNQFIQLDPSRFDQKAQSRAASVLRGLGFDRYRDNPGKDGRRPWRYRRSPP